MTTTRLPVCRLFTVPLLLTALIVGSADALADEPVSITNTSSAPWKGLSVSQGGVPVCTIELAPGSTLVVADRTCKVGGATMAAASGPNVRAQPAAPAAEVDLLGDEDDLLGGEEVVPVVASPAPKRASSKELQGHTTISAGFGPARRVGIFNDSDNAWSGCSVVLNGEWSYTGPTWLDPGEHEGIMGQRFVNRTGDFMVQNHVIHTVQVSCNEGVGTFTP